MAELQVEIVAADHFVFSGAATLVKARTADGEIGIMPGHSPLLAILAEGELEIVPVDGERLHVRVSGGFFSVDSNKVVIVADNASLHGADDSVQAGTR
ncbi:MAG: F0F1 ATP synthase subunit epsilon [Acidobacteria bacterium]|nr:F0F1 ATP synthase subunit epsilon [Acidobacteriota bacterium]